MAEINLPPRYFERRSHYRRTWPRSPALVSSVGFLQKPTRQGEIVDQVPDRYVAVYLLRGRGEYVDHDGSRQPLVPGDVAQRLPGRRHSTLLEPDGEWAECYLELSTQAFMAMAALGAAAPDRPVLHPGLHPDLVESFENILLGLEELPDEALFRTCHLAHRLMFELLERERAGRPQDPHGELIERARLTLGADLSARLSLPELATGCGLSYERFRKVFRDRTGLSPGDYRIRRRIEHACGLLVQEGLAVKEAAYRLGYPDAYSFSKQFKQVMGESPDSFRRSRR